MPPASVQSAPQAVTTSRRPFGQNYAFVVIAVIFLALLASAGLRATPGVLMLPLQKAFGWDVSVISSSAAVGIFLYGLAGPFAAAVMQALIHTGKRTRLYWWPRQVFMPYPTTKNSSWVTAR